MCSFIILHQTEPKDEQREPVYDSYVTKGRNKLFFVNVEEVKRQEMDVV